MHIQNVLQTFNFEILVYAQLSKEVKQITNKLVEKLV